MKEIEILDCTLRDGGRIIDCQFKDDVIIGIGKSLKKAKIDIVELGFLRNHIQYQGNSTFFGDVAQADAYIRQIGGKAQRYVLFVDYGLYDIGYLAERGNSNISGIRYGFTKKNYQEHREDIIYDMRMIKKKGYDLYLQTVFTNGYTTAELLELIELANEIHPLSFGVVDTYGSMYLDDLEYLWNIVNRNLKQEIAIDFHSHNNMQMSFAMTQRIIQLSNKNRHLIIDATMNGMGKCAGNLNTELIVDYLVRKLDYDYDVDAILDGIDRYIEPFKKENAWGYSIPAFMAGIYKAHPNNVIYLTSKYRLNNRDIKYILSGINQEKRQRYDYDLIQKLYLEYSSTKVDDSEILSKLHKEFEGRTILMMASGKTVETYSKQIRKFIDQKNPIIICINFEPVDINADYVFFTNTIRWEEYPNKKRRSNCIVSSNIHTDTEGTMLVNYSSLIEEGSILPDNSAIMLLNLLNQIGVGEIAIAGFDGLDERGGNYICGTSPNQTIDISYSEVNKTIRGLLQSYKKRVSDNVKLYTITPSKYWES
ncbi:MAG: hypothetical protein PUB24_07085 [Lachnospiraceae bacterium]|nr:hypothetical protein [Lachnospiraceae bacterium]